MADELITDLSMARLRLTGSRRYGLTSESLFFMAGLTESHHREHIQGNGADRPSLAVDEFAHFFGGGA